MPIHAGNENQDTLGDLLASNVPQRGYDPGRWQNEANGLGKNRVLAHQAEGHVIEVIEPRPPVSTLIRVLPPTVEGGRKAVEDHISEYPELLPHVTEFISEAQGIFKAAPDTVPLDGFREAEMRVRKAHGLPLEREAPLPAPLNPPTINDEVKRLEAEARKVRTEVGQDYADIREAVIAMTPVPKRRK